MQGGCGFDGDENKVVYHVLTYLTAQLVGGVLH
jgi:hypothetical protein